MHHQTIHGTGIDIVEVARIRDAAHRWGDTFERRVFTAHELAYCGESPSRYWRLAARFAAKEATLKALGTGLTTGMRWRDVEIQADTAGKPELVLHGEVQRYADELGIGTTFVTMSHTRKYAVAHVTFCYA